MPSSPPSGVLAPPHELNATLPGALAVRDTLAAYETATGFTGPAQSGSSLRRVLPAKVPAGAIDLAGEHAAWASASSRLLAADDGQGPTASSSSSKPPDPFDLGEWAREHGLFVPGTPLLSSTPSTDSVELTSDSGHESSSSSALSSPAPSSPVASQVKPAADGGRLPALLPRIRRASATSTNEFPSPSGSPEPPHALSGAFAGLSLGADLDAGALHEDQSTPTGLSPERRRPRTRDLVDKMRRAQAGRAPSPLPDLEYPTPPPSGRSASPSTDTDSDDFPAFVRPALGAALPRCADDIKGGTDEWWAPMEAAAHAPFSWQQALSPPRTSTPSPLPHGASESPLRAPAAESKRSGRWHKKGKSSAGSIDDALDKARGATKKAGASTVRGASLPVPPATPAPPKTPAHMHATPMMYPAGAYGAGAYGMPGMGVMPGAYGAPGTPGAFAFAPVAFGYGAPAQPAYGVARPGGGYGAGAYGVPVQPLVRPFAQPLVQMPYGPAPGMYAQTAGGPFYGR